MFSLHNLSSHHGSHSDGLQSHSRQNSSEHVGKHSRPVSGLSSDGEEHCDIAREDTVAVEIEDGHFSWEPEGPVSYLQVLISSSWKVYISLIMPTCPCMYINHSCL